MDEEKKGYRSASTHFGVAESTIKAWVRSRKYALAIAPQDIPQSTPTTATATAAQLAQVQKAVDLRLVELCEPARIKGEASPILIDLILKLRTSFKLAEDAPPGEAVNNELGQLLQLTQRTP